MRCDVAVALNLLMARHNGRSETWHHEGWSAVFNSRKITAARETKVRNILRDFDKRKHKPVVKTVKVVDNDVWFIQRVLCYSTIMYMLKRNFKFQNWKRYRLPIYLKYQGKLIVWNGTHRTVLCMLANKRLRVTLIDLDAFVQWRKAHPDKRMWGVRRVINFGKAKGKRRGHRQ